MTILSSEKSYDEKKVFTNLIKEDGFFRQQSGSPAKEFMRGVQHLHETMVEILKYYQRKTLRPDAQSLLIKHIQQLDEIFNTEIFKDTEFEFIIFSEEIELAKRIFKYASKSDGTTTANHELLGQLIPIRVDKLSINPMVLKMLSQLFFEIDDYKKFVRVRKQKAERNFHTVQKIIGSLSFPPSRVRCYRFDFCLLDNIKFNIFNVSQVKDTFLKLLRYTFRGELQYVWFLEFHICRGYSLHFVFFSTFENDIAEIIKQIWHQVVNTKNSHVILYSSVKCDNRLFHRCEGLTSNRSNELIPSLAYMCFREMYYKAPDYGGLNTFGKGNFSNRRALIAQLSNQPKMQSDFNMSISNGVMANNGTFSNFTFNSSSAFPTNLNTTSYSSNITATPQPTIIEKELKVTLDWGILNQSPTEWNPRKTTNAMLLLVGQSGSGKSNSLKLLASESRKFVPVWIFDPHNSMDVRDFEPVLFSSGTESKLGINPFTIYADSLERKGLHDYRAAAIDIIKRASINLGRRQINVLAEALDSLYSADKFTNQDPEQIATQPSPTVQDLLKVLKDFSSKPERKTQKQIIDGCFTIVKSTFSHPVFNREENFDVKASLTQNMYFDLSELADTERFIIMESLLRQVFTVLSANKSEQQDQSSIFPFGKMNLKLLLVIDEARLLTLIGGDKNDSSRIINVIVNEGRKFGIGLILASQRYDHFSKDIHTNVASKLIHKIGDLREARNIGAILNIDPQILIKLPVGAAVFHDGVEEPKMIYVRRHYNSLV